MKTNFFSPSINILRDKESSLYYIPTRNSEKAFQKIVASFEQGTRSFNIIGAYGSGKSAFILALEKVLCNKASYFSNPLVNQINYVESTFIIGEFSSFKQTFLKKFGIEDIKDGWDKLKELIQNKAKSKIGQLWVIDEFGKFLEYAAKENPEEELYFIQQLAEFVNYQNLPIIFISTLHQAFEDYALELSKPQQKEWDKVKGRLIEISFNEPVEQLLFLASERLVQKSFPCSIEQTAQQKLFDSIQSADVFPLRDYFTIQFAQKLFPFDILSAALVTVAFQRYGQNERSLFTMLEAQDFLGLNDFIDGKTYYNAANIYDYLKYNFHGLLNSRNNLDAANWKALDETIQRAESIFDHDYINATKIIKTIGLTAILGRQGQKLNKEFLIEYAQIALGIEQPIPIIEKLEAKQLIRYRIYSQRYVLFKGTDVDINQELELAENKVSKDFSLTQNLKKHFNFPIIPAKEVFYLLGTPRYFVFEITENPISSKPEGQIDGYINIFHNDLLNEQRIREHSGKTKEAILYGWIQNTDEIKRLLIEIEKIQIVKNRCVDDSVAIAELDAYLESSEQKLNDFFISSFYGKNSIVKWFYDGIEQEFNNPRSMNQTLSKICFEVYPSTPKLKNELMNREKVSGTISSAKNKLIQQIIESVHLENLGFDDNSFPPEKTIYLALLNRTGIHQQLGNSWILGRPNVDSFQELWDKSEEYLQDCSLAPRKLTEFIDILKERPLKLKQGFIDFWVPIFLLAKQKYFAFYELGTFIPTLSSDTLEVAMKQPHKYSISTFALDENRINIFNRYRYFLNLIEENSLNSDSFIETIKPFLVFYTRMVPFTKQTKNLSKEAFRLRDAISNAIDPEKIFFEDIPRALGYTINDFNSDQKLEDFSISLQTATRELSSAFPNLINRIEDTIGKIIRSEKIDFPENKIILQQRFKKLKKEQIDPKLRVLIQRINTPLDDRQSWISSIATAIIGKPLDQFTDEDEVAFKSLFTKRIHDLDNLTDISSKDIDDAKEEVLKLELTSFVKGVQRNLIRFPKEKSKQIEQKKLAIREMLDIDDKQVNIALLIKLLQEEIENE